MTLDLTPDELLTTTRAVRRRLDLDRPVDLGLVRECLTIAQQAPTGSNAQDWHFVVVTDPGQRAGLAELYRRSYAKYRERRNAEAASANLSEDRAATQQRVVTSADHLAEVLDQVPVHLVPCIRRRLPPDAPQAALASLYGSILPGVWSFMLAARARELGTAWTTLHLPFEEQAAELLDIPYGEVTQVALIPVAHYTGDTFSPAPRESIDDIVSWDRWGQPPTW